MTRPAAALALTLALPMLAAFPVLAAPAPRVSIASYAQLKTPLPYPYDEGANADAALAQAIARAKATHRRVLVDLGGNWCGDCRILAATLELPEMKRFVDRNFVMVPVDVGRFDRNLQIPARYGITTRLKGVPALLVIDPASGRQLVSLAQVADLQDARNMRPQALADWLAQWTP